MKLKHSVFGISAACMFAVQAYQPLESGLLPLKERLSVMAQDQKRLDEYLSREDSSAEARAQAWRQSKALAAERAQLERDIAQARLQAQSPWLMHAAPSALPGQPPAEQGQTP